ncbi:ligand-effect modulator 3 family [Syncephalis fuscata]|nr:ligand-effect modulator 3 family [Syncephalis fuscata]
MTATEEKSRRPANTAFKQQRLKAWQPILTPKTVLPTLFIIGIIFAPIGGVLFYVSENVTEIVINYSRCDSAGSTFVPLGKKSYRYSLPSSSSTKYDEPRFKSTLINDLFEIPVDLKPPVYMYYLLDNFYQNHRKYVKSFDSEQLKGTARTRDQLATGGCTDLLGPSDSSQFYYPCGLIANSMFNDTISSNSNHFHRATFKFSNKGITWSSDSNKYGKTSYTADQLGNILPPPNWATRYKDGKYASIDDLPQLQNDEHFQVWMRTAGLPTFRKLYGRSDKEGISKGKYTLDIDLHFNTSYYGGSKSIVISTVSFLGGKNPFLGIAYITVAVICVILGCVFTLRHLYKPRKLGDHTYLSWNQQGGPVGGSGGAASPDGPRSPMAGGGGN